MSEYRASYRKATIASAVVALAGLLVLAWLAWTVTNPGRWQITVWAAWGVVALLVLVGELLTLLVFTGGVVSLRRDTLEQRGVGYARPTPREQRAGLWATILRALGIDRGLRPGELVEVRSFDEIAATLDQTGKLDGIVFMPEMTAFCGRSARVFRRVQKIYDWVQRSGLRRSHGTVLLEGLRCSGASHGGCQAGCQFIWKEAWLRRAGARVPSAATRPSASLDDLKRLSERTEAGETRYTCQMTDLWRATTPLGWNDPRHYLRDLLGGNVRLKPLLLGASLAAFNYFQRRRGGVRFPVITGAAQKSPHATLNLQPGQLVRIKSKAEIESTLNDQFRNRGLWFDADMLRFCGGEYRVLERVDHLIEEKSGKMIQIGNPCIVLDGVYATGEYQAFAPLSERIFWREIWLERVQEKRPAPPQATAGVAAHSLTA